MASNSKLLVYLPCYCNDETELQPAVEFYAVKKRNVDLTVPMDLIFFVKEHDPPDGQILKIVCHLRPLLDQLLCLTIKSVSVICIS